MIDKLAFLIRFWALKTRHATGEPLTDPEQAELLSLLQLVTVELQLPLAGESVRSPGTVVARLSREGEVLAVELRYVTAAALVVASPRALPRGASVLLRAADAIAGVEYTLPCAVLWSHGPKSDPHGPVTIALVVDGVPTAVAFEARSEKHPSTPPGGGPRRLVA